MTKAPSRRMKNAVDNIISGEYKSDRQAMLAAGYGKDSASTPTEFKKLPSVQIYLKTLSKKAKRKYNMSLGDKVFDTYLDGMDATKLYGKNAIEAPDHKTRMEAADRIAEFMKLEGASQPNKKGSFNQYNFFSMQQDKRDEMNNNFRKFLGDYYTSEEKSNG